MSHLGLVTDAPENPIAVQARAVLEAMIASGANMIAFISDGPNGPELKAVPQSVSAERGLALAGFQGAFPEAKIEINGVND